MKQSRGLGRGLDSLFKSESIESRITPMSELAQIPLDKIEANPLQPRQEFDEEQIESLAASIKELGIIQPITLRAGVDGRYTIISGERRWRASQRAGITSIPAYIRTADDETMHAMALVENLQRADLNPIEIAMGLQRLIEECSLTQEAMAQKVSMKRSSISNYLRLLRLGDEIQYALKRGLITMGHAKAIASIEDQQGQLELLRLSIEESLSVREAEQRAQSIAQKGEQKAAQKSGHEAKPNTIPAGFEALSARLETIFPKGARIKSNSRGGGEITLKFSSRSEIEQFMIELNGDK